MNIYINNNVIIINTHNDNHMNTNYNNNTYA